MKIHDMEKGNAVEAYVVTDASGLDMSDALLDTPGGKYGIHPTLQHMQRNHIEIVHKAKFKNNIFCCDPCNLSLGRKYLYVLENAVESNHPVACSIGIPGVYTCFTLPPNCCCPGLV
jgi:hypothetical protein